MKEFKFLQKNLYDGKLKVTIDTGRLKEIPFIPMDENGCIIIEKLK